MEQRNGLILLCLLLIIISIGGGYFSTNNYYNSTGTNDHYNLTNLSWSESGHTIDGQLDMNNKNIAYFADLWSVISSSISAETLTLYSTDYNGSYNQVAILRNSTNFIKDIDLNGNDLIDCENCVSVNDSVSQLINDVGYVTDEYHDNEKVNKSGDIIAGDILISNAYFNLSSNKTLNLDYNLLPKFMRNVTSSAYRTSPFAVLNMVLQVNGGIGDGGGPGVIFWNRDNLSEGSTEHDIGRVAVVWQNKTANTSKISFYARNGLVDVNGLTPVLNAYTGQNNVYNSSTAGGDSIINSTLETGNLKLLNLSGSGNDYGCLDSAGTLYRDPTGCS